MLFFLCYGLDGHRDPQLLQTLESVGIAVGGCVLFHAVVLHCDSVVVRGFPFVWIYHSSADFRGGFFVFRDPQKERFGSDTFWGLLSLAVPLSADLIFAAFCELEIRYVLGPRHFLCFLGPSFLLF